MKKNLLTLLLALLALSGCRPPTHWEAPAREKKVKNLSMWYYAAAAMSDAMDQPRQALQYIREGLPLCSDTFLQESFRILRIYDRARQLHLLSRNREVMDRYGDTETARQLRVHCDKWRDYQ